MAKAEKTSADILLEQLKKNMKNELSEEETASKPSSTKKEREFDDMLKQYFSNVADMSEQKSPEDKPQSEPTPENTVEIADNIVDNEEEPEEIISEAEPEDDEIAPWEETPNPEEIIEEEPEEEIIVDESAEEAVDEEPEEEAVEDEPEEYTADEYQPAPEHEVFKYYPTPKPIREEPKITDEFQGTPDSPYGAGVISDVSTYDSKDLSEEDIYELLDLGYEDELKKMYGNAAVRVAKRRKNLKTDMDYIEKTTGEPADPDGNFAGISPGDKELINQAEDQWERVYEKGVKEISGYGMKFIIAGIIALILFAYDNIVLFTGDKLSVVSDFMKTSYSPLVGLLILSASMAVLWKILAPSVIKMLKGQPDAYSVLLMNIIPTVIYDIILMFVPGQIYPMFNYLAAVSLVLAAVCSYLELKSRLHTLNVATSDDDKYLLGRYFRYKTVPVSNGRLIGDKVRIDYAVFKSSHIEGLVRRMDKKSSSRAGVFFVPVAVFLTSGAIAAVGAFEGYSFMQTIGLFMTGIFWLMPFSFSVYLILPKSFVSRAMAKRKCAIIGDASAELYAAGRKICFKDSTFIRPCEPVKFKAMPGEPVISGEIEMIRDMFRTIGGTVEEMAGPREKFTQSTVNSMSMLEVARDGFTATVNKGIKISVGLYDYIITTDAAVQMISAAEADKNIRNNTTVYVSVNGRLKYRYTPEFEPSKQYKYVKSQLADTDIMYAIRSYNPSVNGELLKKLDCGDPEIVRPKEFEMDFDNSVGESGIIATGNEAAVLFPMNACREIVKNRKTAWTVGIVCFVSALVLLVLNTLFGKPDTINSLVITAFAFLQCIPVIPAAIRTASFQRRHVKVKNKQKEK